MSGAGTELLLLFDWLGWFVGWLVFGLIPPPAPQDMGLGTAAGM